MRSAIVSCFNCIQDQVVVRINKGLSSVADLG